MSNLRCWQFQRRSKDIGSGKDFLNRIWVPPGIGSTIHKWSLMRFKSCYTAKETESNEEAAYRMGIFASYTSDRGRTSRTQKHQENQFWKWARNWTGSSQMKKYWKIFLKYSPSSTIKEIQNKTILRLHLTEVRTSKIKRKKWQQILVRMWGKSFPIHCWWEYKLVQPL